MTFDVEIGDKTVTLRTSSSSSVKVVNVLGVDEVDGKVSVIYLDSFIHSSNVVFNGWVASGAITTILVREGCRND